MDAAQSLRGVAAFAVFSVKANIREANVKRRGGNAKARPELKDRVDAPQLAGAAGRIARVRVSQDCRLWQCICRAIQSRYVVTKRLACCLHRRVRGYPFGYEETT